MRTEFRYDENGTKLSIIADTKEDELMLKVAFNSGNRSITIVKSENIQTVILEIGDFPAIRQGIET
jgi:hypothetical protein